MSFLEPVEVDALLAAPDLGRWEGRRDRALLILAVQTGLRLSELTGLNCGDIELGTGAHVRCSGKGRKQRCVPLTPATAAILRVWLTRTRRAARRTRCSHPHRAPPQRRRRRSASRRATKPSPDNDAHRWPSRTLTPHVLRHTCAMTLLRGGVDIAVIALWLGHADIRSTTAYLHADMTIKERALARTTPPTDKPGRYRPPDNLLAFLESL